MTTRTTTTETEVTLANGTKKVTKTTVVESGTPVHAFPDTPEGMARQAVDEALKVIEDGVTVGKKLKSMWDLFVAMGKKP